MRIIESSATLNKRRLLETIDVSLLEVTPTSPIQLVVREGSIVKIPKLIATQIDLYGDRKTIQTEFSSELGKVKDAYYRSTVAAGLGPFRYIYLAAVLPGAHLRRPGFGMTERRFAMMRPQWNLGCNTEVCDVVCVDCKTRPELK